MKTMHLMTRKLLPVILLLILGFGAVWGEPVKGEVFATPDNLKDNVTFWKKIYTEVSLQEGILHDNEYPLIIYKTLTLGDRKGRSRTLFIRNYKNNTIQTLKNMVRKQPSQWTAAEQTIAALFEKYADLEQLKTAPERIRFQQGQRERYKEGLERSGAYMAYIRLMFKVYRIPARIAYLPHVESSFNIDAYSRVGAAGMWQFMRRTAALFNLKIDYRIDERRDPIKSTIAAARLLKMNYDQLKSWPLAITAYNHGLASIKRAVKETGSQDLGVIIDRYKNRRFRFASKNFYGCFLAASEIAAHAEKYFPNIKWHPPLRYYELQLENYLQPKTLEKHLGISQEQLAELNPALRSIVFRRQLPIPRGYKLRIPISLSPQEAKKKLAAVPGSEKKSAAEIQHYYTVRRGDTLYSISRRYKVSLDELGIANDISRRQRIYIGQVLRIPVRGESSRVTTTPPAEPPTLPPLVTPGTSKTSTASVSSKTSGTSGASDASGTVSPPAKETIVKDDTVPALEKPTGWESGEAFDATLYRLEVKPLTGSQYAWVTVSVEESLGLYAEWLNTSSSYLRRLNGGRHSVNLNQKVKIPLKATTSLEQFNEKRLEYHLALEEDFYSRYRVIEVKARKVRYGDTLWSISQRDEEIPIWLLKKYNREIDLQSLRVGTVLSIPVVTPRNNGN
jgi:membrane-bound lytic murein transglycosylase D